jgi:hypothetical protein
VVEPRKRLLGRQERGRAMAQGQGDLLVRTVRIEHFEIFCIPKKKD